MPGPYPKVGDRLEKLLQVEKFPPPAGFVARARVSDPAVYEQAAADPAAWWATQARERLHCQLRASGKFAELQANWPGTEASL